MVSFGAEWNLLGLSDQQNTSLGKLALHLVVFAVLIFRQGLCNCA